MSGCWEQVTSKSRIEEAWNRPAGHTMIGTGRTIRTATDSTIEWEFLRIIERGAHLVYVALPSGQTLAEFTESARTDSSIVFSNPTHDFPQNVSYARRGADSLIARIDGTIGGKQRAIDFPYRRRSCP